MLKKIMLSSAVLLGTVSAHGEDTINPSDLATVSYAKTVYTYQDYELATSVLNGQMNCVTEEEGGQEAVLKKANALADQVNKMFDGLGADPLATLKINMGKPYKVDPVVDNFYDSVAKESTFYDYCEKEKLSYHESRDHRWMVNYSFTLKQPISKGNELTKVVRTLEDSLSEDEFATLACTTKEPYTKDVSEETSKRIWKELEKDAYDGAYKKSLADETEYQSVWADKDSSGFQPHSGGVNFSTQVLKKDGEWVGMVQSSFPFNIKYKAKATRGKDSSLKRPGLRSYSVPGKTTTKEGLYASISIVMSQGCFKDKEKARSAILDMGQTWLEKLRSIKAKDHPETDRIDGGRVDVNENPETKQTYHTDKDGDQTRIYYSACNPKELFRGNLPKSLGYFRASLVHNVRSSDLDGMSELVKSINSESKKGLKDLKVHASFRGMITQDVQSDLHTELRKDAIKSFMDKSAGKFWQDSREECFSEACVVDAGSLQSGRFGSQRGAFEASAADGDYDSNAQSLNLLPEEEGKKLFMGTYVLGYKVFWPLVK